MAESKRIVMTLGKETLEVGEPTFEGITALESLGWQIESGTKPPKPRRQAPKAPTAPFDEAKAREEIAAALRAEIEAQVRAEVAAEAAAAAEKPAK